jgi:putative phosphoesterase
MRIALLADIHSNLPALEAVRVDLQEMAPDLVFLAGDQINRCPWPNEVMELINDEGWPAIYGNHELIVLELSSPQRAPVFDDRRRFADLWWTWAHLKPAYMERIQTLPSERTIEIEGAPPILLMHGLRGNPFEGFYPDMSDEQMAAKVEGIAEPTVVSAHTHFPLERAVGGKQIFNPGSVGMPYNGDPRAQYLLLDLDGASWRPLFRQVEYDRGVVREAFDQMGLFQAYGPLGPLYWQTIATGDPWVSDFQAWARHQAPIVREDLEHAVELYLSAHGPGKWAFTALGNKALK